MSDLTFGLLWIHLGGCLGTVVAAKWRAVPLVRAATVAILFMGASMLSPSPLGFLPDTLWDDLAVGVAIGAVVALIAGRLLTVPLRSVTAIMILCGVGMTIGGILAGWVL